MSRTVMHKRGFSLVEAAIVLGIIGLVIGGIWVAASAAHEDFKVSKTKEGVLALIENTRRINAGFVPNSLAGNLTPVGAPVSILTAMSDAGAIRSDVFPVCNSLASACYGLWGSKTKDESGIRLFVIKLADPTGEYYMQLWAPESACIKLGRSLSAIDFQGYGISRIMMNPVTFWVGSDMTVTDLSDLCASVGGFQIYFKP